MGFSLLMKQGVVSTKLLRARFRASVAGEEEVVEVGQHMLSCKSKDSLEIERGWKIYEGKQRRSWTGGGVV
jgi:hypothetical protein